jgi:hypothetical protein
MRPCSSRLMSWTLAACIVAAQLTTAPRRLIDAADAPLPVATDRDRLQPESPADQAPQPATLCASSAEAFIGRNPVRSPFDVRFKSDAVAANTAALLACAAAGCRLSTFAGHSAAALSPARNLPLLL